jgi:hypothetical protein
MSPTGRAWRVVERAGEGEFERVRWLMLRLENGIEQVRSGCSGGSADGVTFDFSDA